LAQLEQHLQDAWDSQSTPCVRTEPDVIKSTLPASSKKTDIKADNDCKFNVIVYGVKECD